MNRRKALLRDLDIVKGSDESKSRSTKNREDAHLSRVEGEEKGTIEASTGADTKPPKELLSSLTRTFYNSELESKVLSKYASNNYQVKQLYTQAKHADQAGDIQGSKFYLQILRKVSPNDVRVIRRLARLELQQNSPEEARSTLLSGLESFPNDPHLLQGLAQLELQCGNHDRARQYYSESIHIKPDFANPYHALAILEISLGNTLAAENVLRKGLKHCPGNHRLHHALGDLYREEGMLDDAEIILKRGLECINMEAASSGRNLDWSKSFLYTSLSYVAYEKGDINKCRFLLRESVESDNHMHAQGWYVSS